MDDLQQQAAEKISNVIDQALATGAVDQAVTMMESMAPQWSEFVPFQMVALKAYLMAGQKRQAINACEKIVSLDPSNELGRKQLGILYLQDGQIDAAYQSLKQAVKDFPQEFALSKWLGHACHELGFLEEAATAYERAIQDLNQLDEIRLPLAFLYRNLKRLTESNRLLEHALSQDETNIVARFTLAQNQLLQGDLVAGLAGYECRLLQQQDFVDSLPCPLWQVGEKIEGRHLLVFDEQGFGDCIQFARFLPLLKQRAASVRLRLRPKLHHLLSAQIEGCDLVSDLKTAQADIALSLMSLPLALGLDRQDIAQEFSHAYLAADSALVAKWESRLSTLPGKQGEQKKQIGLIWQGDPNSPAEQGRSLIFEDILPLLQQVDAQFFILQFSDGRDRFNGYALPRNVIDLGGELDRDGQAFTDTAAVMSLMDQVITSDTATAHLAGALGVKTSVLLKYVPEWRWELEGASSYWYESHHLCRQSSRGDWAGVIGEVIADLNQ